jgi:hypothetical protein
VTDRVRIELLVEPKVPIRGELVAGGAAAGEGRTFEGWLELISAIQDSFEDGTAAPEAPADQRASRHG